LGQEDTGIMGGRKVKTGRFKKKTVSIQCTGKWTQSDYSNYRESMYKGIHKTERVEDSKPAAHMRQDLTENTILHYSKRPYCA